MCSQKINREKKKKKSEQISTFPQRSFKDSNIEWLPSTHTHTHTKTDINLYMENAHPFRSNSPIPPFNRCDLFYLLVLLLDSFLLSCSLALSRSLAPFQLVLYGRKTFIFRSCVVFSRSPISESSRSFSFVNTQTVRFCYALHWFCRILLTRSHTFDSVCLPFSIRFTNFNHTMDSPNCSTEHIQIFHLNRL